MNTTVYFEPLIPKFWDDYIKIGTKAYNQHYRHLWPNGETATYIQNSFTQEVLLKEEQDKNTSLYLIKANESYAGILKITHSKTIASFSAVESLYIDKIYITKEFTGLGIGRKTLQFVSGRAKNYFKKVIFLEAMQKGPALPFYLTNGFTILDTTQIPYANAIAEEKPMYILFKEI